MPKKPFIKTLLERRIPQIVGSYFVAGTSLILFIEYLIDKYQFPSHYATLALFALIGILPSVIILSYFHGAPGKDEWTKVEKVGIPINVLFIAGILFFGDSLNIWKINKDDIIDPPQKVLIHITSMSHYTSGFDRPSYYETIKGRELIALSDDELSSIRINFESMMLGEFFDIDKYEIIIPQSSENIEFLNRYHLLDFSNESFSNVKENYKRFNKPNHIYYLNIYKYHKDNEYEITKYFYKGMYWGQFTRYLNTKFNNGEMNWGTNGDYFSECDSSKIEEELFNKFRSRLQSRGDIGSVSVIKDDIFYIKLYNLKIKKNMILQGITEYDFKNNGREHRIYDLTQAIKFLKNRNDSIGQSKIKNYNNEIISLEQRTGFNSSNTRVFNTDFNYDLRVVDILDDTTAVTKLVELNYPYVKPRVGNPVIIKPKH